MIGAPWVSHAQLGGLPPVTGHMHIRCPLAGQPAQEGGGVVAEVDAVHIDVVHIQEQQAIGAVNDGVDEIELAELLRAGAA